MFGGRPMISGAAGSMAMVMVHLIIEGNSVGANLKRFKKDGTTVYEIWRPLFFGSVQAFNSKFDPKNDPKKVEVDFIEPRFSDHSEIKALRNIANKYLDLDKEIKLTPLSPYCKHLLLKDNSKFDTVIESSEEAPRYYVITDIVDEEIKT